MNQFCIAALATVSIFGFATHEIHAEQSGVETTSIMLEYGEAVSWGNLPSGGTAHSISVPPGSEILKLEIIEFQIRAFSDSINGNSSSWVSDAYVAVNIETTQYEWYVFQPHPNAHYTGSSSIGTSSWSFSPETYYSHDGAIGIQFFDTSPSVDSYVNCAWVGETADGGQSFPPFAIEVTYRSPTGAATGACCLSSVSCEVLSEYECSQQGGTYLGEDTSCDDGGCDCTDPCGQPNCEDYDACDTTCAAYDPCLCDPWNDCESCELDTVHCVPLEYSTIQEAIDIAADGDLVLVSAGTYEAFELRKPVLVSGVRSSRLRPEINASNCLAVTNGGAVEFMEFTFDTLVCSPDGESFTDRGFVADIASSTGVVRDSIIFNGCGNSWGGNLEFYDCEFRGVFATAAFHLHDGGLTINDSLICGDTDLLADSATGCVIFRNCQIATTPKYGGSCFDNDCEFFETCPDADDDGDGVPNSKDACPGYDDALDADSDGTPDGCDGCPDDSNKVEPGICGCGVADTDTDGDGKADCLECVGDLSDDGVVNGQDLTFLLGAWGDPESFPAADINVDGDVDGADLTLLLGAWGLCP